MLGCFAVTSLIPLFPYLLHYCNMSSPSLTTSHSTTCQDFFIRIREDDAHQMWLDNGFMDRNPFNTVSLDEVSGGGGVG